MKKEYFSALLDIEDLLEGLICGCKNFAAVHDLIADDCISLADVVSALQCPLDYTWGKAKEIQRLLGEVLEKVRAEK